MNTRTIMIFPQFDNIEVINNIRTKYDPLADLVLSHVTLVFPFESNFHLRLCSTYDRRKTLFFAFA
jgi:hypothetical protein